MRRAVGMGALLLASCEAQDVTVFQLGGGAGGASGEAASAGLGGAGTASVAGSTPDVAGTASSGAGGGDGSGGSVGGSSGSGGNSGAGGDVGMPCASNADCPQGWFCEKTSCDAATGSCDLRPTKFKPDYAPVCGCDGVTYWNDVTRRMAGKTLFQAEQCATTARPCNTGADCMVDFASCARLVSAGEQCAPSSIGACWLLPPDCPDSRNDPDLWRDCRPPPNGLPPPPCVDTCLAIKIERPFQRPRDVNLCQ